MNHPIVDTLWLFKQKLWQKLADESGANQLAVLSILLLSLLTIPPIFDFAQVQFTRRMAQTGSDAASLAAAKEYAEALSISWSGYCGESPSSVVSNYVRFEDGLVFSSIGGAPAYQYAGANTANLTSYQNYYNGESKSVSGVSVPFIEIQTETEKEANVVVDYGTNFDVPAEATAVTYLDRYTHDSYICYCSPEGVCKYIHTFEFFWKISLTN